MLNSRSGGGMMYAKQRRGVTRRAIEITPRLLRCVCSAHSTLCAVARSIEGWVIRASLKQLYDF